MQGLFLSMPVDETTYLSFFIRRGGKKSASPLGHVQSASTSSKLVGY